MSVFTVVERPQLIQFLQHYNIGNLVDFKGISAGIENTNYWVETTTGEYILTLFEQHEATELPYFLELMAFMAEHSFPSAHPIADENHQYLRELNTRPAAFVEKLRGHDVSTPSLAQCRAVGDALANFHLISPLFTLRRENGRGPKWWYPTAKRVMPFLSADDAALLRAELLYQQQFKNLILPRGVVHADLFRDNALFVDDALCGIIDFYYACDDAFLYDLAVTVNDWCSTSTGEFDADRLNVMLEAYIVKRPLNAVEQNAWEVMLRAAALRFWLSRAQDKYFPKPGAITQIKDPDVFKHILIARQGITWQRVKP